MSFPQLGIYSISQLEIHDHYNFDSGGPILTIARVDSANSRMLSAPIRMSPAGVGSFQLMKQIQILDDSPGAMTVTFDMIRAGGAGTVHGQVMIRRGSTILFTGTDFSTAAGPVTETEAAIALDLLAGDTIEVWGRVSAGATTICSLENMNVLFDPTITQISRRPISVPLAASGAGVLWQAIL